MSTLQRVNLRIAARIVVAVPCIVRPCGIMSGMICRCHPYMAEQEDDVQFRKSILYKVPILALPEPMLQAILAVRPIKDRVVCITPHEVPEGS